VARNRDRSRIKRVRKRFDEAVRVVVCDVFYFSGVAPLDVARETQEITPFIIEESSGYRTLLDMCISEQSDKGG
jgi:hypothetical protein